MKTKPIRQMMGLGLAIWLGWGAGSALSWAGAEGLVPYQGTVQGVLLLDQEGGVEIGPAHKQSTHLGKGIQVYEEFALDLVEGRLRLSGLSRSIAANGDHLRIRFEILECDPSGGEPAPGQIEYVGWYTVLPGGTGRFAYAGLEAGGTDLGRGTMAGRAYVSVTEDGNFRMAFGHHFTGTLRVVGKGPAGKAPKDAQ